MKLLALDILKLAKVPDHENVIGKISVRVGGVVVNDPKKIINVQNEKSVDVWVGKEKFTATLPKERSKEHAEAVDAVKREHGKVQTERFEERMAAKKEAREAEGEAA